MSIDIREDVLLRPQPTFAPYSVYVDVSPKKYPGFDELMGIDSGYVSDTFRVWELFGDYHNLSTAKFFYDDWIKTHPEFEGKTIKIYDNNLESFISDHPVFGK